MVLENQSCSIHRSTSIHSTASNISYVSLDHTDEIHIPLAEEPDISKKVSFNDTATIFYTHPPAKYDRTPLPNPRMTYQETMQLILFRKEMQKECLVAQQESHELKN